MLSTACNQHFLPDVEKSTEMINQWPVLGHIQGKVWSKAYTVYTVNIKITGLKMFSVNKSVPEKTILQVN